MRTNTDSTEIEDFLAQVEQWDEQLLRATVQAAVYEILLVDACTLLEEWFKKDGIYPVEKIAPVSSAFAQWWAKAREKTTAKVLANKAEGEEAFARHQARERAGALS